VAPVRAVVQFGQLDDFQDGTTMGWSHGPPSPNPPSNIDTGGPAGDGDRYLQNVSSGAFGAGSRQVMYNQTGWAGDYIAAGVTRIDAMMSNFGATTLQMRFAVQGGPSTTQFVTTTAVVLPSGSGWQPVSFSLSESEMTKVFGTDDFTTALGAVTFARILSSPSPAWLGEPIAATLGVDNIRALRLPGDANFDNQVDITDLGILATNWQTAPADDWRGGDFTFDDFVDITDLGILATNWQVGVPPGRAAGASFSEATQVLGLMNASVPEPRAALVVLLSALGALGVVPRRCRAAHRALMS
jgi:hypothetical protein